ncbi:MAG: DUF1850 domain-containing protein, partial [Spirochaetaceae bacterium]
DSMRASVKLALFGLLILAAAATVYALWPVQVVQLESDGQVVHRILLPGGGEIHLDYQHSVVRAPVKEVFHLAGSDSFVLVRTEHGAFGAGLPTEHFGEFRQDGDRYVIGGINRLLPEIPLRVSAGSEQKLTVPDSSEVALLDLVEAGSLVIITARKAMRWRLFFR